MGRLIINKTEQSLTELWTRKVTKLEVCKYKIPQGDVVLSDWWLDTEDSNTVKIALYWDHNSSGTEMQLIDSVVTSKPFNKTLNSTLTSTGEGQIVIRQWVETGVKITTVGLNGVVSY